MSTYGFTLVTRPARPPRPLLLVLARHHGFGGRGRGGNGRGRGNRGRFVASASAHKNLPYLHWLNAGREVRTPLRAAPRKGTGA